MKRHELPIRVDYRQKKQTNNGLDWTIFRRKSLLQSANMFRKNSTVNRISKEHTVGDPSHAKSETYHNYLLLWYVESPSRQTPVQPVMSTLDWVLLPFWCDHVTVFEVLCRFYEDVNLPVFTLHIKKGSRARKELSVLRRNEKERVNRAEGCQAE